MPTPRDKDLLKMDGWPGGVNNRIRETEQVVMRGGEKIPSSEFLRQALNVDLTSEGHPIRRKGYSIHTSGYAHSIYASEELEIFCVVIEGQLLAGKDPDNLSVITAVNRYNRMSYTVLNDVLYYSNGQSLGEITHALEHRTWGIPVAPTPTLAGPASENPNGWKDTRQVAVTYVDHYGREGGASAPALVGGSGPFTVTIPVPLPPDVAEARIYASQVSSEILYHAQSLITVGTVTVQPSEIGRGKELDTLNMHPPVAGQLLCRLNGRVYIARNDKITFTEALRYHLTRPSQGIYMFSDYVTLMEPSTNGVYVGTQHGIVFLKGEDPYDVEQVHVSPYAPVEMAVTRIPGEKFGVSVDEVPVWWGTDGVMVVGLPGGELKQLTRDRLAVPEFAAGAVSLREYDGMSHIVSSLRSSDGMNPMGASDTVVATVRQNNIVLNS
jgi:hypothetical protein